MPNARKIAPMALFAAEVGLALVSAVLAYGHFTWPVLALPLLASTLRPAPAGLRVGMASLRLIGCMLVAWAASRSVDVTPALFCLLTFERYLSSGRGVLRPLLLEVAVSVFIFLGTAWIGTIGQAYDVFLVLWLSAPRRSLNPARVWVLEGE